jgi:hypothetical protein
MKLSENLRLKLFGWAARVMNRRDADIYIGGRENVYMRRWWVIPKNPIFNIYLHCFHRSDDDRALHDHPWLFNASILVSGHYMEHTPGGKFLRQAGEVHLRGPVATHRIELIGKQRVVTLFITGPWIRPWGFYCPKGWRHWKVFTSNTPGESTVGRGCE